MLSLQPSWYVQSLLFQLCVEVNKVGGHALLQPTLQELLQACLGQALQQYNKLTERHGVTDTHSAHLCVCVGVCVMDTHTLTHPHPHPHTHTHTSSEKPAQCSGLP